MSHLGLYVDVYIKEVVLKLMFPWCCLLASASFDHQCFFNPVILHLTFLILCIWNLEVSNLNQAANLWWSMVMLALTLLNPFTQAQLYWNCITEILDVFEHFGLILNISNMKNVNMNIDRISASIVLEDADIVYGCSMFEVSPMSYPCV